MIKDKVFFSLKVLFFFSLLNIFLAASLITPAVQAACEYLNEDFSSAEGWTSYTKSGSWMVSNGKIEVSDIDSTSTYASTDFYPSDLFSVDVEIEILNASSEHDRVGTRIYSEGDVFFLVTGENNQEYTVDGVLCYYYPVTQELKFKVYEPLTGEWETPMNPMSYTGTVRSIGMSMVSDGIVFRVNGQDTSYKLSGDFSFAPYAINKFRLFGGGHSLSANFDNICASPLSSSGSSSGSQGKMPSPGGFDVYSASALSSPVINIDPSKANPFGFGSAATGGNLFSVTAGLSEQESAVDIYACMQASALSPELLVFTGLNSLQFVSDVGLIPWKQNITEEFNESLLSELPTALLPDGTYQFFLVAAPAGSLNTYRIWSTSLVLGSQQSGVTDKEMEQNIKENLDLIFDVSSGLSGGTDELTSIFEDENVVSTSPSELSLSSIMSGTPITVKADFGSGYTLDSGDVMQGSGQLKVTNISFTSQNMGADFSANFNNITKNGESILDGRANGNLLLTQSASQQGDLSGQIVFDNLNEA